MSQQIPHLYVASSELHDRGVFCATLIPEGSIIEICPVIFISADDLEILKKTILFDYYFIWGEDEKSGAIALGYGSVYNHHSNPNARYFVDFEALTLEIYAIKDIEAGEEITFNYNGDPEDQSEVWFEKE
jgi:uncharacterized protein